MKPIIRNAIGILVLMLAWYLPDRFFFEQREGFQKILPYLLLSTMYVWIVIHNRILLERFYLAGKRRIYFLITGAVMIVGSVNMYLVIHFLFRGHDPLPQILGFWVFTIAGAGIYLLFRERPIITQEKKPVLNPVTHFGFVCDGGEYSLPLNEVLYIESLENYIRVLTNGKPFLVRMSLKEAEEKLSPQFIRISRSHLVNREHIGICNEDVMMVGGRELKIGKVFKRYVRTSVLPKNL